MYKQNTGCRTKVLGCSLFFLLQCCIGIVPAFASTKTQAIETNNMNAAKNAQQIVNQRKQCFDNSWRFKLADPKDAQQTTYNDADWRTLSLPHDWSIEGEFNIQEPTGNDGGYLPAGIGWYRKAVLIPSSLIGKKMNLYFEGVYCNAEVYINGQLAGKHAYGFTSFTIDATPFVKEGRNIVAVRVDNSKQKNCRWYSGSGIYRHVWWQITNQLHFAQWGVGITTLSAKSNEEAVVRVEANVENEQNTKEDVFLKFVIKDPNGKKVLMQSYPLSIKAGEKKNVIQKCTVPSPKLWNLKTPVCYALETTLEKDGKVIDKQVQSFGIRTIEYSTNGLLLNGSPIKLNGGCVHHDNGSLGAAAYDRAEERRIELLKAAGFNAIRTSHNPPSEAFLNACDRIGMLVIDEAFDGWKAAKNTYDYSTVFDECAEKDLASFVERDRNHPSVFCWSIGNEVIERKSPEAVEIAHRLAAVCHRIDPTRPVTSAMTTWDSDWNIFDPLMAEHDICGYNYQLFRAADDHKRIPSRVIIQTESYPREAFTNWALVNDNSYILGDFVWTAIDYLGESGIGRYYYKGETEGQHFERKQYPWHGAYCGDIDLLGWRKPISHYRAMLYETTDEKLYFAVKEPNGYYGEIKETMWSVWPTWESWTWPGHEGKPIEAEIFSRYPKVRLYLNNKLIKEQTTERKDEFKAIVTLPYEPGELKVVGVDSNGKEVESKTLYTAGKPTKLALKADRKCLKADGQDLAFITVELQDDKNILSANAENKLHFDVEGEGEIVATDNALLKDSTCYRSKERKAWKGKAMVIVKTTGKRGKIIVTVSADGIKNGQSIMLTAK